MPWCRSRRCSEVVTLWLGHPELRAAAPGVTSIGNDMRSKGLGLPKGSGLSAIAAALLCLIAATAGLAQQPAAIPVGTLPAELRPVTQVKEFVGRVDAVERVDIRARVTGFLQDSPVQGRRHRQGGRMCSTGSSADTFRCRGAAGAGRAVRGSGQITPTPRRSARARRN